MDWEEFHDVEQPCKGEGIENSFCRLKNSFSGEGPTNERYVESKVVFGHRGADTDELIDILLWFTEN